MSFHRRYNGIQPEALAVDRNTGSLPRQTGPGAIVRANPVLFPPTPEEVFAFRATNPIRSYAPGMFGPKTLLSFSTPDLFPVRPFDMQRGALPPRQALSGFHRRLNGLNGSMTAAEREMAELAARNPVSREDARVQAKSIAADRALQKAQAQADTLAMVDAPKDSSSQKVPETALDPVRPMSVLEHPAVQQAIRSDDNAAKHAVHAADAAAQAQAAVDYANKLSQRATDAQSAKDAKQATQEAKQMIVAADAAASTAQEAKNVADGHAYVAQQVIDESGGGGGGGGGYDPGPEATFVDPSTGQVLPGSLLKRHPYVATGAAAGVGFIAAGPIGALVGALVGYFVSKPAPLQESVSVAMFRGYRRR